jgi:hypothetical protein
VAQAVAGQAEVASIANRQSLDVSPSLGFYRGLYVAFNFAIDVTSNEYVHALRSTEYRHSGSNIAIAAFKKLLCIYNNVNPTNVVTVKTPKPIVLLVQITEM